MLLVLVAGPVGSAGKLNQDYKQRLLTMKKSNIIPALVAASMVLTTINLRAGDPEPSSKDSASPATEYPTDQSHQRHHDKTRAATDTFKGNCFKASYIMGKAVQSDSGEHLGKVQDIILNFGSGEAPYLIVSSGGALGIGATRVAVPFREVRWLPDSSVLALSASKDKFESAPTMPTAGWAAVAGEDWAKGIDRFYGEPATGLSSRFERQPMNETKEGAEPVRTPADQKGATDLLNGQNAPPNGSGTYLESDSTLSKGVNKVIKQDAGPSGAKRVQTTIRNGVVTLTGSVASQEEKQRLEDHIKALPGVDRVDNQLMIKE